MSAPGWLTARPVAHRGLHNLAEGVVENTRSAAARAVEAGFAIECDVQRTVDGEAMVFHDFTLDRLTTQSGPIAARTSTELQAIAFTATADPMMRLSDLLALVGGRVPLIVEIKSRFDGDLRLTQRVLEVIRGYEGPLAVMSFDDVVVAAVRRMAPQVVRGIVAERNYVDREWDMLSAARKRRLAHLLHYPQTRFHFINYRVRDLPTAATWAARALLGVPLLTWTVRTPENRTQAARWADQMVFEGFRP